MDYQQPPQDGTNNPGGQPPQESYQPPQYPAPPMPEAPPVQGGYAPVDPNAPQPPPAYTPSQGEYTPPQGSYTPPQGSYMPPQGGYQTPPPQPPTQTNGKAVAALVMGILSLVFVWFGYSAIVGLVLAIVAVALGVSVRKETPAGGNTGLATGGMVTGIIGIILNVIGFAVCVLCAAALAASGYSYY